MRFERLCAAALLLAALLPAAASALPGRTVFLLPEGGRVHAARRCPQVPEGRREDLLEFSADGFSVSEAAGRPLCEACFGEMERPSTPLSFGQIGENGLFYPLWQPEDGETRWEERTAGAVYADLTHDGLPDRIETVVFPDEPGKDAAAVVDGAGLGFLRVFPGLPEGGFADEARFVSRGVSGAHAGNGTFLLARRDGGDCLVFCDFYRGQGTATDVFTAFWLSPSGVSQEEALRAEWETGRGEAEEAAFLSAFDPWTEDAETLILAHADAEAYVAEGDVLPAKEALAAIRKTEGTP